MKNSTVFICISTKEYLNYYTQLYNSIKKHCPNTDQILYFIGDNTPITQFDKIININELYKKTNYIGIIDKICSIRPSVVLDAFNRGYEKVIFCGADIEFFNKPTDILIGLDHHNAVVTPHLLNPLPEDEKFPSNVSVLQGGHLNSDLVGWYKCDETINFLKWQENILKTKCVSNNGIFLDQTWLNFLPFIVPNVLILRSDNYNVAYWNLKERNFRKENDEWKTNDGLLVVFQYSGLPIDNPERISIHQNRYVASGDLLEFLKDYAQRIRIN